MSLDAEDFYRNYFLRVSCHFADLNQYIMEAPARKWNIEAKSGNIMSLACGECYRTISQSVFHVGVFKSIYNGGQPPRKCYIEMQNHHYDNFLGLRESLAGTISHMRLSFCVF